MTDQRRPWMKFYPSDWRADPRLRMCSLAARGMWMDMISLMHEAVPYGFLIVNGISPNAKQLAGILGGSSNEIQSLITELEEAGVFSRDETGRIFSRRMVRDQVKSVEGKAWADKGWTNRDVARKPNGVPIGVATGLPIAEIDGKIVELPITQKLDTRSQNKDSCASPEFLKFWEVYPLRKAKPQAERALARALKSTTIETILAGAERYAKERAGADPKYTAHPATWLNAERWNDQPSHSNGHSLKKVPATQALRMLIDAGLQSAPPLERHAYLKSQGVDPRSMSA